MEHWNEYQFKQKYFVHWGDMDAAQHVNNLIYLRWAESARIYFFEKILSENFDFTNGVGPILAWQDCKYIFPITYPDYALLGVKITSLQEDRFSLETRIFSEKHNRLAAINKQVIMAYDYEKLAKANIPATWREVFEKLMA